MNDADHRAKWAGKIAANQERIEKNFRRPLAIQRSTLNTVTFVLVF